MVDKKLTFEELNVEVQAIREAHSGILCGIEAANKKKSDAKNKYDDYLDEGNEESMKASLATIRAVNDEIVALKKRLGDFPAKIQFLYNRHNELLTEARDSLRKGKEKLDQAESHWRQLKSEEDRVHYFLDTLNKLNQDVKNAIHSSAA